MPLYLVDLDNPVPLRPNQSHYQPRPICQGLTSYMVRDMRQCDEKWVICLKPSYKTKPLKIECFGLGSRDQACGPSIGTKHRDQACGPSMWTKVYGRTERQIDIDPRIYNI